ncbi:MAG: hypothetical protein IJ306_03165 [Oscillospiraceae bacterium]|nr:hypothetical protein [Oscillospiraceae bacterium]
MKKIILILLCFVLLFAGCEQLQKAEPYYTETRDDITLKTQYEYYFDDESNILCVWNNESAEELYFHDTFELHILGDDGEWYRVSKGEEVTFNTGYSHFVEPDTESNNRYELSVYTKSLKEGETYRISTYCFDGNDNRYQIFAEFTCDNKLAEEEMKEVSGGYVGKRSDPEEGGSFEIIDGK